MNDNICMLITTVRTQSAVGPYTTIGTQRDTGAAIATVAAAPAAAAMCARQKAKRMCGQDPSCPPPSSAPLCSAPILCAAVPSRAQELGTQDMVHRERARRRLKIEQKARTSE